MTPLEMGRLRLVLEEGGWAPVVRPGGQLAIMLPGVTACGPALVEQNESGTAIRLELGPWMEEGDPAHRACGHLLAELVREVPGIMVRRHPAAGGLLLSLECRVPCEDAIHDSLGKLTVAARFVADEYAALRSNADLAAAYLAMQTSAPAGCPFSPSVQLSNITPSCLLH